MRRKNKPERTFVYLLHFDKPISDCHTAQHYIGYTDCLPTRIAAHRHGTGSRFCQVAKERSIGFQVARLWEGDRTFERSLKEKKHAARLCPLCNPKAAQLALFADDENLMSMIAVVNHTLHNADDVQFS